MKSKYIKIIISFVLVVSLCLICTITPAIAISEPILIGGGALAVGGLAWAIATALGIDFNLQNYTYDTVNSFIDPFYKVQSTLTTSDFAIVKAFRSGYDALQLSIAAYQALKTGVENIVTDENIQDNSSGAITFQSAYDVPLNTPILNINYDVTGNIPTPDGGYVNVTDAGLNSPKLNYYNKDGQYVAQGAMGRGFWPLQFWYYNENNQLYGRIGKFPNRITTFRVDGSLDNQSFNYVSGTIDTTYGDNAQNHVNVLFPTNPDITVNSPLNDVAEYINYLAVSGSQDVSLEVDTQPAPPIPIPSDALGDIPFDQFIDIYGGSVFEKIDEQTEVIDTLGQTVGQYIDNQTDVIDTYGQSVVDGIENQTDVIDTAGQSVVSAVEDQTDVIDTVGQDVVDAVESVDTNIQTGNGILSGIRSLVGSAVESLENIAEHVGDIVDEIVLGTEKLISGILNQIPPAFNVILGPIKQASSIWHYVVEWIQSIGAPFQFIWSMASGTSYYIILPVYASLAAAVVLAFYKRFGK